MKETKQNIEQLLKDRPELFLIIQILNGSNQNLSDSIPLPPLKKGELDLDEFIRLVKHHRLDSILYREIVLQNIDLPSELKQKLEQINKRNKMRMLKLTSELIRIHQLFTENNIDYISLKGPALSQQIYGDYTIRNSRDLDILIRIEDLDKANFLLNKIEYTTDVINFKKYQKAFHAIEYINKERKIKLEIHTRFFSFNKLYEYHENEIFENKETIIINNDSINILNKKRNSDFLYMHAKKHSWELFYWIADLIKLEYDKEELINDFLINQQKNKRDSHFSFLIYTLSLNKTINHKINVIKIYYIRFINWAKNKLFQ